MYLSGSLAMHSGKLTDQALPYLATLASAFAVLYSVRFIHQTFFGPAPVNLHRKPAEAPIWMRVPIEILVLACLIIGIVPAATIGPFLDTAVHSVLREEKPSYTLAVWHGLSQPLLMSVIALFSGGEGYLLFQIGRAHV